MKRLLITALLISSGALALESPIDITRQEIHRVEGGKAPKIGGKPVSNNNSNNKPKEVIEVQNIKQETIYQFPEAEPNMNFSVVTATPIESAYKKKTKNKIQGNSKNTEQMQGTKTKKIYEGYCDIPNIKVSIEKKYVHTECVVTNGNPRIQNATIELIPEIQEYKLVGKVIKMNGQSVKSIKVLSPDKSTDNIAKDVDRRLISNILLQVAQQTGQTVAGSVQGIFQNAGNTTTTSGSTTYIDSNAPDTGENIQQELNQIPKEAEYLAIANLVGDSANELLDGQKQLPPIFTPYSQVFVEFEK